MLSGDSWTKDQAVIEVKKIIGITDDAGNTIATQINEGEWEFLPSNVDYGFLWLSSTTTLYEKKVITYTKNNVNRIVTIYKVKTFKSYIGGSETKNSYSYNDVSVDEAMENVEANRTSNGLLVSYNQDKILYFINYARLYINSKDAGVAFGFLILYIILIVFTVMFMFRYVKRVIYVAFLTLIAPMVALTYPLDKIKDRKSTSLQHVV